MGIYESQDPIDEVIQYLRERMLTLRYDLNFQKLPASFPDPTRTFSVISQLKILFPLFYKGTEENRIDYFASTLWQHEGKSYPVIIFQYDYVIEIATSNQRETRNVIRKINKQLWGGALFSMRLQQAWRSVTQAMTSSRLMSKSGKPVIFKPISS